MSQGQKISCAAIKNSGTAIILCRLGFRASEVLLDGYRYIRSRRCRSRSPAASSVSRFLAKQKRASGVADAGSEKNADVGIAATPSSVVRKRQKAPSSVKPSAPISLLMKYDPCTGSV